MAALNKKSLTSNENFLVEHLNNVLHGGMKNNLLRKTQFKSQKKVKDRTIFG